MKRKIEDDFLEGFCLENFSPAAFRFSSEISGRRARIPQTDRLERGFLTN